MRNLLPRLQKEEASHSLEKKTFPRKKDPRSLNRSRALLLLLIVLTVSIIPLSLLYGRNALTGSGSGGGPPNARSGAYYPTLATLKGNSTIVAVANVLNLTATFCDYPHPGCLARDFVFKVEVSSYLKGSGNQTIYAWDNSFNGPILVAGSKYVLFLESLGPCLPSPPNAPCVLPPTPTDMTYTIVGGAQGKFLVQNDLVYGYKALYPNDYSWLPIDANGIPLSQFEPELL